MEDVCLSHVREVGSANPRRCLSEPHTDFPQEPQLQTFPVEDVNNRLVLVREALEMAERIAVRHSHK